MGRNIEALFEIPRWRSNDRYSTRNTLRVSFLGGIAHSWLQNDAFLADFCRLKRLPEGRTAETTHLVARTKIAFSPKIEDLKWKSGS